MRRSLTLMLMILFCCPLALRAQGENNIWTFGFEAESIINFNTPTPTIGTLANANGNTSHWAAAVCYPNGQLRFSVRMKFNFGTSPEYYIFDALGNPVDGSDLETDAGMLDFSMPVIIPRPGNADQYYIFHSKDDGLFYSLLDMSLNGGNGSIVPAEKNIVLTPPGSVYTRLISGVKGCEGAWVVIRSPTANEYYSYHIKASGIDTQKVVSTIGNFPLLDYNWGGFLKSSPDGTMLATTNWAGVEWYDFEQCSGKVTNARVLDTTGNPPLFPGAAAILPIYSRFTGVCFSPDNSKLYVSKNRNNNLTPEAGKLFQFDLNQPTLMDVINSKVLILTNLPFLTADISGICGTLVIQQPLGEIKAGPDGRIYIDNGSDLCLDTALVPAGYNPCPGFHAIDAPNMAGLGCLPSFNRIKSPGSIWFYASGDGGVSYLQHDIVLSLSEQDTIPGTTFYPTACFSDSFLLSADETGHCLEWDNGSNERTRMVYEEGRYYVGYFKNCSYTTDTFVVNFIPVPALEVISNSCPENATGWLKLTSNDTGTFRAVWKDAHGIILQDNAANNSDELNGVGAGSYAVHFSTTSGCDTILYTSVSAYPALNITVSPIDTTIRYGDTITLRTAGAYIYAWWPTGALDTPTKASPLARPLAPTRYSVMGIDENGCRDTGYINIDIDYSMPDFVPNAFSPNGDGLNDVFGVVGMKHQKIAFFKVYNRYGQVVFSAIGATKGWDGTQNNKPCDPGIYYYLIELDYPDGRHKTFKGDVTLMR